MNARILIVDDEEDIREMLSRHFRLRGYDTVQADSVDSAVEKLNSEPIQVIISDIMMPGKPGTDLLPIVRKEFPMARLIMMTGYVTMSNALTCMRNGADTLIFKPLGDLAEMDEAVDRIYKWHCRWQEKLHKLQQMRKGI